MVAGVEKRNILVVDDERQITRVLKTALSSRGYSIRTATDGDEALHIMQDWFPDIVITDLRMPNMDGLQLCKKIRAKSQIPIIILSVKGEDHIKVEALDAGADDYVTKPFSMDELLARVRATLRRGTPGEQEPIVETADFRIDLAAKRVTGRDGDDVRLTPTEWGIVEVLVRNRGKLVSQRQLLQEVWGPRYEKETDYVRVYLAAIRRKLEPEPPRPRYFLTEPGMGYRFTA